jgi:cephalosporin hydroxylase
VSDVLEKERRENALKLEGAKHLQDLALDFMRETGPFKYTYNFRWMGVPIVQFPQDLIAVQEIIWDTRPEVVIETGIAHGGGLVFYASLLQMAGIDGQVIGVEIDFREHNRRVIDAHPMAKHIQVVDGSSIDRATVKKVTDLVAGRRALVILDSNHTHEHVAAELELYAPLVKKGQYLVVFDTTIEDQPEGFFAGKPWSKTNNPKTAVREFLRGNDRFEVDTDVESRLLITVAREGYLRCMRDLRPRSLSARSPRSPSLPRSRR